MLIKPHQRITKYPLLLQAVLKKSSDTQTKETLNAMVGARAQRSPLWTGAGEWESLCRYPDRTIPAVLDTVVDTEWVQS